MADLCDILSELRKDRHLSQREMAAILHVSPGTISNYETGKYAPSYDTLIKLADFFDVTTDYLLGRTASSFSIKKLEEEYIHGKSLSDIIDIMLSFQDNSRELTEKAVEVIRVYNAVDRQGSGTQTKK